MHAFMYLNIFYLLKYFIELFKTNYEIFLF